MARLPEALDSALKRCSESPGANLLEAMHEQGISTKESLALVAEVRRMADNDAEAAAYGVYIGILIGRGLAG